MNRNYKSVLQVTKSTNKKGKLKGKNKKETKTLKGICTHHRINKKGKLVKTLQTYDKDHFMCTMCKGIFLADFLTDKEITEAVDSFKEVNNQMKFMTVAMGSNADTVDYFTTVGASLEFYKKAAKRVTNLAKKQEHAGKHKKKNKNNYSSSRYGSWSVK